MKLFMIEEFSVDSHSILGIYTRRDIAEKDFLFFIQQKQDYYSDMYKNDNTYKVHWSRITDWHWGEQCQFKEEDEPWRDWEELLEGSIHGNIRLQEIETKEMPLQDKVDKINAWQNNSMLHPLTCGNDSSHPILEPFLDFYDKNIGIRCLECGWTQHSDHSVFRTIYGA
jgi:hypothetical protein